MPLEATMMILDNSEYMRNGDYAPTRFDAMADAAHIIFQTKTDSNPENSVGVMTCAGKGPEVLVTHTRELGHIVAGAHAGKGKLGGGADIQTAINVATLALKHRQNKNSRQRIIFFVGSPPEGHDLDEKNLTKLAKKLKKNNVALDVIAFGDGIEEGETTLLKALVDGVNNGDNSHYVAIAPDPRRLLSDQIMSSAVLAADRGDRDAAMADMTGSGAGPSADGGFEEYGGIDPTMDPELAIVMRMSMEEERARQRALQQTSEGGSGVATTAASSSTPAGAAPPAASAQTQPPSGAAAAALAPGLAATTSEMTDDDDEAAEIQEALRLSQQTEEDVMMGDEDMEDGDEDDVVDPEEDEDIQKAIAMSMDPQNQDPNPQKKK